MLSMLKFESSKRAFLANAIEKIPLLLCFQIGLLRPLLVEIEGRLDFNESQSDFLSIIKGSSWHEIPIFDVFLPRLFYWSILLTWSFVTTLYVVLNKIWRLRLHSLIPRKFPLKIIFLFINFNVINFNMFLLFILFWWLRIWNFY